MDKPIGIIDSGLGGLAIGGAIGHRLPHQSAIYLADHAFFPYGSKSPAVINKRLIKIVDWLLKKNCQLIVIACNTITATAIDRLRRRYQIPFVGTEPAVKLGGLVLVTPTTAASRRYQKLAKKYPVVTLACPGLAEAIERGRKIDAYLPKLPPNTKTVVLGCTHYILAKDQIQKIYGRNINLIDPSGAIARQTEKVLGARALKGGRREFYTTGSTDKATRRASRLFRQRIIFSRCSL